jgi:hypothetical protein
VWQLVAEFEHRGEPTAGPITCDDTGNDPDELDPDPDFDDPDFGDPDFGDPDHADVDELAQ